MICIDFPVEQHTINYLL